MKVSIDMYADDTQVYVRCKLKEIYFGALVQNLALAYIAKWTKEHELVISSEKSTILQIKQ